jgi:hypothetical protein
VGYLLTAMRESGESNNLISIKTRIKKWGAHRAPRKVKAEELPLLRGLFLAALGFLRHCFLLGCCDSASDEPLGRHYWWAEPSTLIPDVDYG